MERITNSSDLIAISFQLTNSCGNTIWKAAKNKGLKNHKLDVTGLNYWQTLNRAKSSQHETR